VKEMDQGDMAPEEMPEREQTDFPEAPAPGNLPISSQTANLHQ
jgi:hypothetical protein